MEDLVNKMLGGNEHALARLISIVEREEAETGEIMKLIYRHTGRAYCIGFTGPPGAGKSTLVDKITRYIRNSGKTVGIVAVDPTSPFSGGAVLGDRIRMQQHYLDDGVFIRSMATRGSHGGLPKTIRNVVRLLDAFGKDFVLIETVGVGQTELDIIEASDTIVVILVPEAGDAIQTMKAGLMEIADVFAVNKADRDGADYLVAELDAMLRQSHRQTAWNVPVLATQGIHDIGTTELYQAICSHCQFLTESGKLTQKRQAQRKKEFFITVEQGIASKLWQLVEKNGKLSAYLEKVEKGEIDPYSASTEVLNNRTILENWLKELEK